MNTVRIRNDFDLSATPPAMPVVDRIAIGAARKPRPAVNDPRFGRRDSASYNRLTSPCARTVGAVAAVATSGGLFAGVLALFWNAPV